MTMKKWLSLMLAACMMFMLLPAANMEEYVENDAAYALLDDDVEIEVPDEIEAPVGEVVMELGGPAEVKDEAPEVVEAPADEPAPAEEAAPADAEPAAEIEGADDIESAGEVVETDAPADNKAEDAPAADDAAPADDATPADEETAPADGEVVEETVEEETAEDAEMAKVSTKIKVTKQPEDQKTTSLTKAATFTVKATKAKSYEWEYQEPGTTTWKKVTKAMSSSYRKLTLKIAIKKKALNGMRLRCKLYEKTGRTGNYFYTNEVILSTLKVETHPTSVVKKVNTTVKFTAKATGTSVKYQWQSHAAGKDASEFKNISKATKKEYSVKLTTKNNGTVVRCLITDKSGAKVYTKEATMSIAVPSITKQPKDVEKAAGETVTFKPTIKTTNCSGVKYQWQVQPPEGKWASVTTKNIAKVKNPKTKSMSFPMKKDYDGYSFRLKITATGMADPLYSDVVKVTIPNIWPVTKDKVQYNLEGDAVTVVKYTGTAKTLTIPETIEGYTVKAIGEGAFEGNKKLTSIDLPDTIEVIGKRAFANCTKLSSMS